MATNDPVKQREYQRKYTAKVRSGELPKPAGRTRAYHADWKKRNAVRTAAASKNWIAQLVDIQIWTRFWASVEKGPGCWNWNSSLSPNGYGFFQVAYKKVPSHRYSYLMCVGPIQKGMTIDHLCRNRICVNPAHLEQVTNKENILRGVGASAINAKKTHCKYGHAFTAENTELDPRGNRSCRTCSAQRGKQRWERIKNARANGTV